MAGFDSRIVCTYLYVITKYGYPPPAEATIHHLEEMETLGFRSIELEGIREEHLTEVYNIRKQIKEELLKRGLQVPYFCIVLPGLSSPDTKDRQRNLKLFELGCETAATIGAVGVLDNAPLPPYHFPENIPVVRHYDEEILRPASFADDLDWDQYWNGLTATYREACTIAGKYGLSYSMHPCLGVLAASAGDFLHFAAAVNKSELRFNLDTANQYALKENINMALLRLKEYVDYIHLSDNRGTRIEHLQPGAGTIQWAAFFSVVRQVGFSGHFGLDIGGAESEINDIDRAYVDAAHWLQKKLPGGVEYEQ